MNKPCLNCTRRHIACHDKCEDYQANKPKYSVREDEAKAYLVDKHWKMKKKYGGWD